MINKTENIAAKTIHGLIEQHALRRPDSDAILAENAAPLSYARLYEFIQETACQLLGAGIHKGDIIVLVLPDGPELTSALLTVASCAICAPLNPDYKKSEFDSYLMELTPKALIYQRGHGTAALESAEGLNIPVIELLPLRSRAAGMFELSTPGCDPVTTASLSDANHNALLLHTSGTTAIPKLVPLTHHNLCCASQSLCAAFGLGADDCSLSVMPLFHIHGLVGSVLACLAGGGRIFCTDGFDGARFIQWLEQYRPTYYTASPTFHREIVRLAAEQAIAPKNYLRIIRSTSAPLPPSVMLQMEKIFGVPVLETYGLTEAAPLVSSNPLPPGKRKAGSVGRPVGCRIKIITKAGAVCSANQIGEILLQGPNVMTGYYHNPEANTEAFVNDWLRTGDSGYQDEDGYLFITGRLKEIINRGGEKISPQEIDAILLEHPDLAAAATFALPHPSLGEEVALAVVILPGRAITEVEIRTFLKKRMANFKIPQRILFVESLPRNAAGKVQRERLVRIARLLDSTPKPRTSRPSSIEHADLEQTIVAIWREVLQVNQIAHEDNFFRLGGDSLMATRCLARLAALYDIRIHPRDFFDKPTVADLATMLGSKLSAKTQYPPN